MFRRRWIFKNSLHTFASKIPAIANLGLGLYFFFPGLALICFAFSAQNRQYGQTPTHSYAIWFIHGAWLSLTGILFFLSTYSAPRQQNLSNLVYSSALTSAAFIAYGAFKAWLNEKASPFEWSILSLLLGFLFLCWHKGVSNKLKSLRDC
jgi:hypothetical protein